MMSCAAWSSSSTEVDVELSQWFWAWPVRSSASYSDAATRSRSRPLAICSWSTPPSSDTTDEAEQHRRRDDAQLQRLAPAAAGQRAPRRAAEAPSVGEAPATAVPTGRQCRPHAELGGTGHAQARPAL